MASVGDTTEEQTGAVQANRHLRRAVDRCLGDGIRPARVAQALVRMAEAVASEVAEEGADYRTVSQQRLAEVPFGKECPCGRVYSEEHCYCSRCGEPLQRSVVPKVIPGRLQFEKRAGRGGIGVVYEAIDLSLGRRVAVKTLPGVTSQHDVARLRREAQALAAVSHRHLAAVYGFEVVHGTPMIIMQFVDGGTLADKIPLPLDVAIEVMLEITDAVQCLHTAGILHRDIKPRNIGFTRQGELKLLDFGLARIEDEVTMSGVPGHSIVGTPAYMSPEALSRAKANPAFDIWALSVVFYEMLTGCRPFAGEDREDLTKAIRGVRPQPIDDHLPGCDRHLQRYFEGAFHREPSRRPTSALQVSRQIQRLRPDAPVPV
ncbi:MAG: serine/threonine protein kinase [Acidobacteria bacterium]|nr:serine/threonine protein kinase [Acidobacteriota bacterium]